MLSSCKRIEDRHIWTAFETVQNYFGEEERLKKYISGNAEGMISLVPD
jgi:hypothetical protein